MEENNQNTEQNSQLELEELAKTLRRPKHKVYLLGFGVFVALLSFIALWMYAMSVALNG